jgi:hypothetical protein
VQAAEEIGRAGDRLGTPRGDEVEAVGALERRAQERTKRLRERGQRVGRGIKRPRPARDREGRAFAAQPGRGPGQAREDGYAAVRILDPVRGVQAGERVKERDPSLEDGLGRRPVARLHQQELPHAGDRLTRFGPGAAARTPRPQRAPSLRFGTHALLIG